VINSWRYTLAEYNPTNPDPSHYTQVVWRKTTHVGCAALQCNGIFPGVSRMAETMIIISQPTIQSVGTLHVCEYDPPGNVIGQFA
jgi:pathogenesis-related protein 1